MRKKSDAIQFNYYCVPSTNQFNFKQSDVYEDSELLNCSQSLQQSNDPGINMLGQRPRKPVNHPRQKDVYGVKIMHKHAVKLWQH